MSSAKSQKSPFCASIRQVSKINNFHSDLLSCFHKTEVKAIIANSELYKEAFGKMAREFVSRFTNFVTMVATTVDRGQSCEELVAATGRKQYVHVEMVSIIPCQVPAEVADDEPMVFFKLDLKSRNGWISDDNLEKEYVVRGLVADPYYQFNVNRENPEFADDRPNACHWKDESSGRWCFATFQQRGDDRCVIFGFNVVNWEGIWWFAGRRKS